MKLRSLTSLSGLSMGGPSGRPVEWDALRSQLKPCVCGAPSGELAFRCAQLCSAAWVYCSRCGLGTPAHPAYESLWPKDQEPLLWARDGETGTGDARPKAIAKWNAYVESKK